MTAISAAPDIAELVATLAPTVRQYAAQAEAARDLAPAVMTALRDAGLNRIWVPRALGGLELDPVPALQLFEELSRLDASVGWVVGNATAGSLLARLLPDAGAAEVFADPRTFIAGATYPQGTAIPVAGGYRISGQWPFNSGGTYANWLFYPCRVMDGAAPRLAPHGSPVLLTAYLKAEEAEILDTWHTLGMRGTGSHDVRVSEVFVPNQRTILRPADQMGSAFRGPLYRMGLWPLLCQIALTGLGIARAALDDFIALAAGKTPTYTQTELADRPVVQDGVARAQALIEAARSYLYTTVRTAWEFVQSDRRLTTQEGIPLALAATSGLESAVKAVELVHSMAGTSAIREEQRFQQYFRDVHTASQHALTSSSRFESLGKLLLGRPTDFAFYSQ